MTKRKAFSGGPVSLDRLVERCKGKLLKARMSQIAPAIEGLGYRELPDKTPCMIGNHQIITVELPDECAGTREDGGPGRRPVKLQWNYHRGILERCCGSYNCPSDEYRVQMDDNTDGLVTLHHIATHPVCMKVVDPPVQHLNPESIEDEEVSRYITAATDGGMFLADLIKTLNPEPVNVHDGKNWWTFTCVNGDGRWRIDHAGNDIDRTVIRTITRAYGEIEVRKKSAQLTDAAKFIIKKVNQSQYRKHLVHDCKIAFKDVSFRQKLDSKPNLIGCKNGVYDIDTGEFRDGRPTDYLTLSTHVNYLTEPFHERPEVGQIRAFIDDVLDDAVAKFIHKTMCMYLHGETNHTRFFIWVGCGSNGKSKLQNLYRLCLGDYAIVMPAQVVCGKQVQNGQACPELRRAQHRRLIFFSEPSTNETLASGMVKMICR